MVKLRVYYCEVSQNIILVNSEMYAYALEEVPCCNAQIN